MNHRERTNQAAVQAEAMTNSPVNRTNPERFLASQTAAIWHLAHSVAALADAVEAFTSGEFIEAEAGFIEEVNGGADESE